MPTLAGLNGASMVPNTIDLLEKGRKAGQDFASDALTPELVQRVQAGDQDALTELSTLNPQAAQNLFALQGQQRKQKAEQQKQFIMDERTSAIKRKGVIQQVMMGGSDSLRNNIAKIAADFSDDPDYDADEIVALANLAITDPESAMAQLQGELDATNAEIAIADQILTPISRPTGFQKTGSFIVKNPDGTTGIATGVFDPQTGSLRTETTTFGSDQLVSRLGETAEEQAAREVDTKTKKEVNKLKIQFKLKPAVEAAVTTAVESAKANIDSVAEGKSNAVALSMYDTAMSGLTEALGGTTTGPVAGWLPAVTTNQQVAEGAIAAMAPILKQLFRGAGEGTFTDKDQELLVAMLPTRKDTPEARVIKVQNIDAIVRAKLSAQEAQQQEADLSTMSLDELIKLREQQR